MCGFSLVSWECLNRDLFWYNLENLLYQKEVFLYIQVNKKYSYILLVLLDE